MFISVPIPNRNYYDHTFRVAGWRLGGGVGFVGNHPTWLNEVVPFEGAGIQYFRSVRLFRYNPDALSDLSDSYEWSVQIWGAEAARKWYNEIETVVEMRLSSMPTSCPIAPENKELDLEVRQLIYGRYRILFAITGDLAQITH